MSPKKVKFGTHEENFSVECDAEIKESTGELEVVLCQLAVVVLVGVVECWSGVHGCPPGPPPPPTLVPGVASLAEAGLVAALSHHTTGKCSQ